MGDAPGCGYGLVKHARDTLYAIYEAALSENPPLAAGNPVHKARLPNMPRPRKQRALKEAEVERLLTALTGRAGLLYRIFLFCGLRPGELAAPRQVKAVEELERRFQRRRLKVVAGRNAWERARWWTDGGRLSVSR